MGTLYFCHYFDLFLPLEVTRKDAREDHCARRTEALQLFTCANVPSFTMSKFIVFYVLAGELETLTKTYLIFFSTERARPMSGSCAGFSAGGAEKCFCFSLV